MSITIALSLSLVALVLFLFGWLTNSYFGKKSLNNSKIRAQSILENAKVESDNLKKEKLLEANEEFYTLKQKLEDEYRSKKQFLHKEEGRLNEKDTNIDRKSDFIAKRESELNLLEKELKTYEQQNQVKQEKLT